MIRTRDFVLFVVTLLFLGVGIVATLVGGSEYRPDKSVQLTEGVAVSGASTESEGIDRQSVIDRLRDKIRNSDLVIASDPSVTEDAAAVSDAAETNLDSVQALKRCAAPDDALSMVPHWPLNQVEFETRSGKRTVFTEQVVVTTVAATASGTPATESTETMQAPLLTMPLYPSKLAEAVCVPSEVIGVSDRGVLMFNGDMRAYRSVPADTRIGYARDGYPIYGVYEGEVDACGGYDHPTGYRYTVSATREYVVGCYVATPQKITVK